jgi:hypothetical protein
LIGEVAEVRLLGRTANITPLQPALAQC